MFDFNDYNILFFYGPGMVIYLNNPGNKGLLHIEISVWKKHDRNIQESNNTILPTPNLNFPMTKSCQTCFGTCFGDLGLQNKVLVMKTKPWSAQQKNGQSISLFPICGYFLKFVKQFVILSDQLVRTPFCQL